MENQPDSTLEQTGVIRHTPVPPPEPRQRHPWRVDFKWVFAIPFTVLLILTLAVLTSFQASSETNGERTISAMMHPLLSDPQFRGDVSRLDPDLLIWLESPGFASTVYEDPETYQERIDSLPEDTGEGEGQLTGVLSFISMPIVFISGPAHSGYTGTLIGLVVLTLIFGSLAIGFSRRVGRLVTAGICLALASWLPLLSAAGMRETVPDALADSEGGREQEIVTEAYSALAEGVLDQAVNVYGLFSFLAVLLLIGAGIALLVLRLRD